jgi:hypothetical protein
VWNELFLCCLEKYYELQVQFCNMCMNIQMAILEQKKDSFVEEIIVIILFLSSARIEENF